MLFLLSRILPFSESYPSTLKWNAYASHTICAERILSAHNTSSPLGLTRGMWVSCIFTVVARMPWEASRISYARATVIIFKTRLAENIHCGTSRLWNTYVSLWLSSNVYHAPPWSQTASTIPDIRLGLLWESGAFFEPKNTFLQSSLFFYKLVGFLKNWKFYFTIY